MTNAFLGSRSRAFFRLLFKVARVVFDPLDKTLMAVEVGLLVKEGERPEFRIGRDLLISMIFFALCGLAGGAACFLLSKELGDEILIWAISWALIGGLALNLIFFPLRKLVRYIRLSRNNAKELSLDHTESQDAEEAEPSNENRSITLSCIRILQLLLIIIVIPGLIGSLLYAMLVGSTDTDILFTGSLMGVIFGGVPMLVILTAWRAISNFRESVRENGLKTTLFNFFPDFAEDLEILIMGDDIDSHDIAMDDS